jgi:CheY-like chemotaxis protein
MHSGKSKASRAHILLIDQNQDALQLLESMLGWRGYRVTTAVDGLDGLEKFQHGHFQLILTNLSTPRMSGWELGRIVKQSSPTIPVALVTGLSFDNNPDHSPFDAIISKPIHLEDFHCLVDSLIGCEDAEVKKPSARGV